MRLAILTTAFSALCVFAFGLDARPPCESCPPKAAKCRPCPACDCKGCPCPQAKPKAAEEPLAKIVIVVEVYAPGATQEPPMKKVRP